MIRASGMLGLVLAGCATLAGCSTHPAGDILDFFKPGRIYTDGKTTPYGGVCQPQGPLMGPGAGGPPQINVGPPTPVVPEAPAAPVIPPPVPITAPPSVPGAPVVPPPPPPPVP